MKNIIAEDFYMICRLDEFEQPGTSFCFSGLFPATLLFTSEADARSKMILMGDVVLVKVDPEAFKGEVRLEKLEDGRFYNCFSVLRKEGLTVLN